MKIVVFAVLLMSLVTSAAAGDINPAAFTKTGHVMSSRSSGRYLDRGTQVLIGNLVYDSQDTCKEAFVGSDYPALVDGNHFKLLVGAKVCSYKIRSVTEVAAP
jgi:hypothetical protein